MREPYTVHRVDAARGMDGLYAPEASLASTHDLRETAQAAASRLVREGGSRAAEVRQRRRLLDSFVRRGERSAAHVYTHKTRGGLLEE